MPGSVVPNGEASGFPSASSPVRMRALASSAKQPSSHPVFGSAPIIHEQVAGRPRLARAFLPVRGGAAYEWSFDPRSRAGSDYTTAAGGTLSSGFDPRSRAGSDAGCIGQRQPYSCFDPRSRAGSDPRPRAGPGRRARFDPRSRAGSDPRVTRTARPCSSFRSALPCRERLYPPQVLPVAGSFDPRSRAGSDTPCSIMASTMRRFDPRSRAESDD